MKKSVDYNEWDVDEKVHPSKYKAVQRNKELTQKYRVPVYAYETLIDEESYEYDEQHLHEASSYD